MTCDLCHDVGWVLERSRDGSVLDLLPCPIPDCARSGIAIKLLGLPEASTVWVEQKLCASVPGVSR